MDLRFCTELKPLHATCQWGDGRNTYSNLIPQRERSLFSPSSICLGCLEFIGSDRNTCIYDQAVFDETHSLQRKVWVIQSVLSCSWNVNFYL